MKGQSSIEFLTLISLSTLVLAGLYGVMVSKQGRANEFNNRQTADLVAEKVSFQVEMALVQGGGYSRVFSVPDEIAGGSYNVTVREGSTIVEWGEKSHLRPALYEQREINMTTKDTSVFRIINNGEEVVIVEE